MKTKISVIMGIYNCEKTLGEAIDSILSQTLSSWELIMCDDGSTDGTKKVAEGYRKKYPDKIFLLENEKNLGLNLTLNRCLEKSCGEYIARMDADDISLPQRFEAEAAFLDNHPEYAIVSTPMVFFDENGDWGKNRCIKEPTKHDFIRHCTVHCHAPCMVRREAYLAVGGYSKDKRTLRVEDVDLWFRLYSKGYTGYNLDTPLYKMRDDRAAAGRRSLRTRLNGAYVLFKGYKLLGLPLYSYGYIAIYTLLQIVKGIMPKSLYLWLRKKKMKRNGE